MVKLTFVVIIKTELFFIFSAPSTKKVALTTIPISKNYVFGKDDIDEMLFMLKVNWNFKNNILKF